MPSRGCGGALVPDHCRRPHYPATLQTGASLALYLLRAHLPWQAEENSVRTKRVKSGGNKKKSFTEGWVEFADKKRAMRIARTLNNTQMMPPNNHRSFYANDLWNIK